MVFRVVWSRVGFDVEDPGRIVEGWHGLLFEDDFNHRKHREHKKRVTGVFLPGWWVKGAHSQDALGILADMPDLTGVIIVDQIGWFLFF